MNSFERVTCVLKGGIPDRVPIALHNYLMAARMFGNNLGDILRDGASLADAQILAWREFRHDVIMLENGVCAEAEALGCKIRYSPELPPHVEEPVIQTLEDLDRLTVPDPESAFPLNELLRTTRIVAQETKGTVFINGRADQGPIALACALCGPEQFLTMMMEPQYNRWCHKLLDLCSKTNIALGLAQHRAGAHSSTIGIAGTSFISPAIFREFEFPRVRAFCQALNRENVFSFIHSCGNETHLLDDFLQTRASCLELDPRTDPTICKQKTSGKTAVLGMIDPSEILRFGSPAQIEQHTAFILQTMAPLGGFLAGPGCALPADTPLQNIHTMIHVIHKNGRYAADGSLAIT